MQRRELEHVLRAAGAITGVNTWVVVGSQAILGALPDAPAELLTSEDADVYAPDDASASDLIDGSIGERSMFHESFGYYGHGVGAETATLPERWRERSVTIHSPATSGVTGICPSPADLAISKIVAWREKDQEFVRAMLEHRIVSVSDLQALVIELPREIAERVRQRLSGMK